MALIDIVKYEGGPNIFAWKFPNSELSTKTQLIVNETQEAILFKGGQALDVFGAGRHTLETKNIPILSKLVNLPFGGHSPFTAEVWFVNKIHSLDIKWGTLTPISLFDPFLMVDVKVKSFGQFGIRIENSKMFLEKLVGTLPVFTQENITAYFKGEYLRKCTSIISSYFSQKSIGILQVNTYLDDLSDYIRNYMKDFMSEYGITLLSFSVNNISADENDSSYKAVKEAMAGAAKTRWTETAKADAEAYTTRQVGTAKADVMGYEQKQAGYTYQQKRSFDVMESAASNEGGGMQNDFMTMGMGLAMGNKMGAVVGTQMGNMATVMDVTEDIPKTCEKCGAILNVNQKFCSNCGADTQSSNQAKCVSCGALIDGNSKFCPECGASQIRECPECKTEIKGTPKFCPECGNKL